MHRTWPLKYTNGRIHEREQSELRAFVPSWRPSRTGRVAASSQSPPPSQDPFPGEEDDDQAERPRLMPQVASLRRSVLRRGCLQPARDARRVCSADVAAAGVARDAAEEAFVQPGIGKLTVGAADEHPAIG